MNSRDIEDYYRKRVNSNIFKTRSRSENRDDPREVKQEYARILQFQMQEREERKKKRNWQERKPSPEEFMGSMGREANRDELQKNEKQKQWRNILEQQIEDNQRKKEQDRAAKENYDLRI